jgi:hypothetical protein
MKKTLIVMSSKTGEPEKQTRETLARLTALGAGLLREIGTTDVALARCRSLSGACDVLRANPDRDMVLMLDDDMQVDSEVAQSLVDHAREVLRPCSAAYATLSAKLAATRWVGHRGLWLVGLGCVAIPRSALLALEEASPSFSLDGQHLTAFTWCGAEAGDWVGEDYRLSKQLGGVLLLPLGVGHVKKALLWVDDSTLNQIAEGDPK